MAFACSLSLWQVRDNGVPSCRAFTGAQSFAKPRVFFKRRIPNGRSAIVNNGFTDLLALDPSSLSPL